MPRYSRYSYRQISSSPAPLHEGSTKLRPSRASFIHVSRRMIKVNAANRCPPVQPLDRSYLTIPWNHGLLNINICTKVAQLDPGVTNDASKKVLTLAMISARTLNTHLYRRLRNAAIQDGGAGIFIFHTTGRTGTVCVGTGKYCTNYKVEFEAIIQALRVIEDSPEARGPSYSQMYCPYKSPTNNKIPVLVRLILHLSYTRQIAL